MQLRHPLDHKIWGIAGPAILSNISIPLLGLVDAAILGHLGSTRYLAAVAVGGAILSFLYWGFSFLRMGTTGLVAKAMGAQDRAGAGMILAQSGVLALLIAAAVILLHPLLLGLGFSLMAPQPEIAPLAQSYATIRIASAPAVLLTYAIVGWFIGQGDTRWPLFIVVSTNCANIGLDFLLIMGLGLNSDGAALATVVAEYLGCGLALYGVLQRFGPRPDAAFWRHLRQWSGYQALLRSNRHLFVRTVCLLASFAFFTAMGDNLGGDVLAANALMLQLLFFASFAMDGFAFAAEALTGNSLGAGKLAQFHLAVRRCSEWTAVSALLLSLIFLGLQTQIFQLLTNLPSVLQVLQEHRYWLVFLPLVAAPSYLLDGVFIGTAETRYMMITMLLSALLVYLPVWYLSTAWGNHGLWLAFTAFNAARGLSLYWCYRHLDRTGGWLQQSATGSSGP